MKSKFLALLACIPLLAACGNTTVGAGQSADYPKNCKSVDVVVGFSAGGATDLAFRILADELTKELGTDFRVVNSPGGGGVTGINKLLTSKKDGCTIGNSALPSHLQYLFPESPAKYTKEDFSMVAAMGLGPQVLVVKGDSPYGSLEDLVAAAKEKGRLDAVADGPKGADAIINAQFASASGIDIRQVIVDGSAEKVSALLGGQVDFFNGSIGGVMSAIQSGQLKALAVWSENRTDALPDVPTAQESGTDVVSDGRFAVIMPAGVPETTRQKLEEAIEAVSKKESFITANAKLGVATDFQPGNKYSETWDEYVRVVKSLDLDSLN